ncbi:MAG: hypothetical protein Q8O14_15020 [bacterium]|jgi:hypothetical protein|nr:hypothetical protein [bacterium]
MMRPHLPSRLRPLALAALLVAVAGCDVDRFPLPSVAKVGETGFGAGDSSYLLLNRQIVLADSAVPTDLFINDDGHIYVAEAGSGRISVWDQALNPVATAGLTDFSLPGVKGVAVGPEQLLFAVAGDNVLWAHNLAAAREPLVWGLSGGVARHRQSGIIDTLDAAGIADRMANRTLPQWEFLRVDSLDLSTADFQAKLRPHPLWAGAPSTRLDAVARGRAGKREVFVANNNTFGNRLSRIRLKPSAVLFTANPDVAVVYLYEEAGSEVVSGSGTGLGTVDRPLSLDADGAGTLYLTQAAPTVGYWKVQRLTVEEYAGVDYWSFDFGLQGRAIMAPQRFWEARDITYTATGIFVLDRRESALPEERPAHRVQVYRRNGDFLLPLGARKILVDTTLVVNGAPVDTLLKVWRYDQLGNPRSVAVYGNRSVRAGTEEEIVYVADGDRIKLFMLSVSTDDLPIQ